MKNVIRRLYLIIVFLYLMISLTSCWSNIDIRDKAFVGAIGYDKAENGNFEVTLQIVKPEVISAGVQGGGLSEKAIWVFSSKGETLMEAVRNQLRTVNRKPFFSHMALIVIGEDLAKEDIDVLFDVYERSREARLTPSILIAKHSSAKKILSCISELEDIPAMHIKGILKNNEFIADTLDVTVFDLLKQIDFCSQGYAIGAIQLREEVINNPEANIDEIKDKEVKGVAVFKENKLIGWLDAEETKGLLFVTDEVQNTIVTINNPNSENKKIAVEVAESKGTINVDIVDEKLKLSVDIKAEGNIAENQGRDIISERSTIRTIEAIVREEIRKNIEITLDIAQNKYKTDFFDFNKKIYEKYPHLWREIENDWNETFSELDIEVNVEFHIKRTGLILNR